MWIGNAFSVCVSVYLLVLVSVSAFVTVWARTFEVVYPENSFFYFDVNPDKVFAQRQTYRHSQIHINTQQTNYLPPCTVLKGNFLLFGIAIVFGLQTLILADSYISPNVS